jgi:hypothetical protein
MEYNIIMYFILVLVLLYFLCEKREGMCGCNKPYNKVRQCDCPCNHKCDCDSNCGWCGSCSYGASRCVGQRAGSTPLTIDY